MSKDTELLKEILDVFKQIRHWTDPDYYREQVVPTVNKIRDRIAIIETDEWIAAKQRAYEQSRKRPQSLIENDFMDTEKSSLPETNFGIFRNSKL